MNPPDGVEFVAEHPLDGKVEEIKAKRRKRRIPKLLPNRLRIKSIDADLVYTFGHPVEGNVPWVIEIDNVCCLGYYSYRNLVFYKNWYANLLRLDNCRKIICISEAARNSVVNFFDDDIISRKCEVVYPYVKLGRAKRKGKKLIFLCCNRKYWQKGTGAVIKAFRELNPPNAELWVISDMYEGIVPETANIFFRPAGFSKQELYADFYSKADVLVQPTLQDSFGLVYLEAMANGMAVISTDVFAIPEFVDDTNGLLLPAPFYMFDNNFLPKREYFPRNSKIYKDCNYNRTYIKMIKNNMEAMAQNKRILRKMQANSLKIARTKFSEKVRKEKLGRILREAV